MSADRFESDFSRGEPPAGNLAGEWAGRLLVSRTVAPVDLLFAAAIRVLRPWLGKRIDAGAGGGENLLAPAGRTAAALLWPAYRLRPESRGRHAGFRFRLVPALGGPSGEQPVLTLDYDLPGNPRFLVQRVVDEVVETAPGVLLGRWLVRGRGRTFLVGHFVLERAEIGSDDMASERPVRGQTVLVTGAARGIGAESARRLAAAGANVALVGLEPEELERVAASCGTNAAWFEADVTDWDALERAVEGTVERFGGIDAVVANAGIASAGTIRSSDPHAFERTIEVNLLGVWRTVRSCLPHVIERRGYVLVVASLAAAVHAPGLAAYSASKAGAEAFADSLRSEVKHLGVDVGVGYFSWIATDMVAGGDAHPAFGKLRDETKGPAGKVYPVSDVGRAVLRGIERRSRAVVVPGWARVLLLLRGLVGGAADRGGLPVEEMDRRFEAEVERSGAESASAPVGAGGAAGADAGRR